MTVIVTVTGYPESDLVISDKLLAHIHLFKKHAYVYSTAMHSVNPSRIPLNLTYLSK
jgi:hypothetical protein